MLANRDPAGKGANANPQEGDSTARKAEWEPPDAECRDDPMVLARRSAQL